MPETDAQGADNEQIQRLLDRHKGDAMSLALQLFGENYQLREKNRALKAQVPAEGSLVVSKADHDKLEAYKTLGKPDELKSKLEAADALTTENATLKRADSLRAVAATGWSFDALKDFDALEPGLEYFTKDEKDEKGNVSKVAYVKADGKETPLAAHIEAKRPHLMASLKEGKAAETQTGWGAQGDGGKAPSKDLFTKIREDVKRQESQQVTELHPFFKEISGRVSAPAGE
jgi:hypothetical protein